MPSNHLKGKWRGRGGGLGGCVGRGLPSLPLFWRFDVFGSLVWLWTTNLETSLHVCQPFFLFNVIFWDDFYFQSPHMWRHKIPKDHILGHKGNSVEWKQLLFGSCFQHPTFFSLLTPFLVIKSPIPIAKESPVVTRDEACVPLLRINM